MEQNTPVQQKKGVFKPINTPTTQNHKSKLDALLGNHTTSVIVGILFLSTLLSIIILVCVKDKLPDGLLTGLVGLLGMFGGFFAGTYRRVTK